MKISFIIPVYNCEQFLEPCVYGIECIGAIDYEIILVDDGSTDNSMYICDKLAKKNKKIHCIHQKNQGVSVARNNGLKISNGDYIFFIDADDTIEPKRFFYLIKKLEKDSTINMAIFGVSFDYYNNNRLYRQEKMKPPLEGVKDRSLWIEELQKLYYANSLSPIWNKIFKRSFLIDNQLYLRNDMFLYEDLEYSVRCMAHCDRILFEPEIIYHYRQNEGNVGSRLKRLHHISSLIDEIEVAFSRLIEMKNTEKVHCEIKKILLTLYLVLVKEKITVSKFGEIACICDEFAAWYKDNNHYIASKNEEIFINILVKRKVVKLIIGRNYMLLRHKIAIKIKSIFCIKRND